MCLGLEGRRKASASKSAILKTRSINQMLVRLACLLQLSSLGFAKALLPSARELCPAVSHAQPLFSPRSHAALGTVPRAALTLGHRPRRGTGVLFSLNGGAVSSTFEASANQPGWVHLLNKGIIPPLFFLRQ